MNFSAQYRNGGDVNLAEAMEMTLLVDCWVERLKNGSLDVTELERAVGAEYVLGRSCFGENPDQVMASIRKASMVRLLQASKTPKIGAD